MTSSEGSLHLRARRDARHLEVGERQRAHGPRASDDVEQRLRALPARDPLRIKRSIRYTPCKHRRETRG